MQNDMEPDLVDSQIRENMAYHPHWLAAIHTLITSAARDDKSRDRDRGGTVPSPSHRIESPPGYCPGAYERVGDCVDAGDRPDRRSAAVQTRLRELDEALKRGCEVSVVIDRTSQPEAVLGATVKALAERIATGSPTSEAEAPATRTDALQEMLQLCAKALVRQLDVAFARIWTLNETADVLELRASAGLYVNIDGPYSRIPLGQFKVGRIAQERAPHFTNELLADPYVGDQEWVRREGMVAFAGYPLVVQDRLLGVVGMFAHRPIGAEAMSAMGSVAKEISLGFERELAAKALWDSH